MGKETTPSETEWLVMEVIWQSDGDITASEIISALKDSLKVSARTIRVLINRLLAKGVINSTLAVASFIEKSNLSDEQFQELEQMVEKMRKRQERLDRA